VLLKEKGIQDDELERAKDHLKSSIILGLENNLSKMRFNLNQELYLNNALTINEIIETINGTTSRDIMTLLNQFLILNRRSILLFGNVQPEECGSICFD
jgi:predicted Zn-dependent peptidase